MHNKHCKKQQSCHSQAKKKKKIRCKRPGNISVLVLETGLKPLNIFKTKHSVLLIRDLTGCRGAEEAKGGARGARQKPPSPSTSTAHPASKQEHFRAGTKSSDDEGSPQQKEICPLCLTQSTSKAAPVDTRLTRQLSWDRTSGGL